MPRIIHTMTLVKRRKGENFDIDPKEITSPNGKEKAKVSAKIVHVSLKPERSLSVTSINDIVAFSHLQK